LFSCGGGGDKVGVVGIEVEVKTVGERVVLVLQWSVRRKESEQWWWYGFGGS
jgi:hypothetical protein